MPPKRSPPPAGKPVGSIVHDVSELPTKTKTKTKISSASLVDRVSRAIERELNQIEHIVGGDAVLNRTEAERRARTLASLAKTLSEIVKLSQPKQQRSGAKPKRPDDDAIPRDLDEFRRELSRRLERMVEGAASVSDEGNAPT